MDQALLEEEKVLLEERVKELTVQLEETKEKVLCACVCVGGGGVY